MTDRNDELFMILDEIYDNYTVSSLELFIRKLAEILKFSLNAALKLCKIQLGNLKLAFPILYRKTSFPFLLIRKEL